MAGESYHIRRFRSKAFDDKLKAVLQSDTFDIIQLETLYLAPYVKTIRAYSKARIVMRAHNVEHEIWERITNNTSSRMRKWYLRYLTRKLKEYEIQQFPSYDYLVTLTERDLHQFKSKGYTNGASAAPIGFDMKSFPATQSRAGQHLSLCFIGSLDWVPNFEGLSWFLSNCWPTVIKRWPGITLHIAGRNTPASLMALKLPNVTVHGEVGNATDFISRHSIMIVPLFSGSGMRVKIVEGMCMEKVVITTTLGKEGIAGEHKKDFLVANDVKEFIEAIAYCIQHPEQLSIMGQCARETAAIQFDGLKAAQQIMGIYQALLTYKNEHHLNEVTDSLAI
jgi:glycosyltransferase involved in cell wall biosynthesis